jgi:17beta-estradiol 17-dehydrogenase / very-long-chain 3-oxoacyl-CoA reductase
MDSHSWREQHKPRKSVTSPNFQLLLWPTPVLLAPVFLFDLLSWLVSVFGVVSLLCAAAAVAQFVRVHLLRAPSSFAAYGGGDASHWALVTGASDGIGKQYALQLAARGFNVVLLGRSANKLADVAAEVAAVTRGAVQSKVVVLDLARATPALFDKLAADVAPLALSVLVNNAGLSHELPERFGDADLQRVRDIVAVNVVAVNEITHRLLPQLLKAAAAGAGKRALVLNVGSASGILATPYLAAYAASKSYLAAWSHALQHEYRADGVDVDCPLPFFVVSNMSKRSRASATIPTAEAYVKASLSKAGRFDAPFAPFFVHGLMELVMRSLPLALTQFVVAKNLDMHVDIRRRALKKAAASSK